MDHSIKTKGVHDLIASRKSIRAFGDKEIDDKNFVSIFEAARWASSSRNEQPWRFIAARKKDKESFHRTLSCINESNWQWAQFGAMLIVVLARKNFTSHPVPNNHAHHDVGLAIGNLVLQATSLGIYMHQMGGIDYVKVREVFEVPEEYDVISIIVGGYPGNNDSLPDKLRERELQPRHRKDLKDLVFESKFGKVNPIFGKEAE